MKCFTYIGQYILMFVVVVVVDVSHLWKYSYCVEYELHEKQISIQKNI